MLNKETTEKPNSGRTSSIHKPPDIEIQKVAQDNDDEGQSSCETCK